MKKTNEAEMAGDLARQFLIMEEEIETLRSENKELKIRMEKTRAIGEISMVINQVNDIAGTIASGVEARTALSAAQGDTHTQKAAAELALMAEELHSLMAQFKY